MDACSWVERSPSLKAKRLVGTPGFSWPLLNSPRVIALSAAMVEELGRQSIQVAGHLDGNTLVLPDGSSKVQCNLHFAGTGNTLVVGEKCQVKATIRVEGNHNTFIFAGDSPRAFNATVDCRAQQSALYVGRNCSAASVNFWLEGKGKSIFMGDDAQCSWNIWVRVGEGHGLIDLQQGCTLHRTEDVVIGPHVWLGQDVIISKGLSIGAGSIIGARAIVTRSVPARVAAAGAPARVIKHEVSWTRSPTPEQQEINRVTQLDYLVAPPDLEAALHSSEI